MKKLGYALLAGTCIIAGVAYRSTHGPSDAAFAIDASNVEPTADTGGPPSYRKLEGDWRARQDLNAEFIQSLSTGVAMDDVMANLGAPDFWLEFDHDVDILLYRTRSEHTDFVTTPDETAALVFKSSQLVAANDSANGFDKSRVRSDVSRYAKAQAENAEKIAQVDIGTDRAGVIDLLGRPDFTDYPASGFEILSYRTRSVQTEGFTTRDETTPLLLEDGRLIAIGAL